MSTFEELERLNAQIDVWIDEEDYGNVIESIQVTNDEDDDLEARVEACFRHLHCTDGKDDDWRGILHSTPSVPATRVRPDDPPHDWIDLSDREGWSQLFYAKLLRARIMQRGTDCYLRHLDEVVAYLENHLPAVSDEKTAKLAVIYLLELSAASLSFEIIGFAERAQRMMSEHRNVCGETWCWFYDLLAKYNIGIGQFHLGRYRRAIVEFNRVIKEVREAEDAGQIGTACEKPQIAFFKKRHGYSLLYLPAVRYRADVQLKLQLAYHALDTLSEYFRLKEGEVSAYKAVSAKLVEAEAYRQMGMVGETKSWERLTSAYGQLSALEKSGDPLGERTAFTKLPKMLFNKPYRNVKGRFLDIYVEDHLEWLKQSSPEDDQTQRIHCSEMLQSILVPSYFDTVKYNALSRNGYYQQLTKLLAWLVQAKYEDGKLASIAGDLYDDRGQWLLEKPPEGKCSLCNGEGVDFKKMMSHEHFTWLKEYMLYFFEHLQKSSPGKKPSEQSRRTAPEDFITRFIKEEQARQDLRISDLELRYKSEGILNRLESGCQLCYGSGASDVSTWSKAFSGLLDGTGSDKQPEDERDPKKLHTREYEQIIRKWGNNFLGHLRSESNHEGHKNGLYLLGLQRWNSSSPAQGRSVGGGYLLYRTDCRGTVNLGIAIDPGFDFVRNLFHMGFSISDIDIVLISHSHVDHVRDFESMITLLHELGKRDKQDGGDERDERKKCIHVILSLGVYERLKHIIEDPTLRYHVEPYIIDARREIEPGYFEMLESGNPFSFIERGENGKPKSGLMRYRAILPTIGGTSNSAEADHGIRIDIQPTRAYHPDPSNYSDSFGFKIKITERAESQARSQEVTLGYTGDTKWIYPCVPDPLKRKEREIREVSTQYSDCDAMIVHLGSLVDLDKGEFMNCRQCKNRKEQCEELVRDKDHPYLVGLLRMLFSLKEERERRKREHGDPSQLVLVSEFGEELRGGIRTDLIGRLKRAYGTALNFLPVDVGMEVQLSSRDRIEADRGATAIAQKVWCIQCGQFVEINDAEFESFGVDEALFCVCRTCRKATPFDVLQDRLRYLYEIGRELRTLDAK